MRNNFGRAIFWRAHTQGGPWEGLHNGTLGPCTAVSVLRNKSPPLAYYIADTIFPSHPSEIANSNIHRRREYCLAHFFHAKQLKPRPQFNYESAETRSVQQETRWRQLERKTLMVSSSSFVRKKFMYRPRSLCVNEHHGQCHGYPWRACSEHKSPEIGQLFFVLERGSNFVGARNTCYTRTPGLNY